MGLFNVRVYGILFDSQNRILISDEYEHNTLFTKFVGGGLEVGEGTIDGLKREFLEECNLKIQISDHIYTTDFYVKSAFNDSQVISIYYLVTAESKAEFKISTKKFDFPDLEYNPLGQFQAFRWVALDSFDCQEMTFETERHVANLLKKTYLNKRRMPDHE